MRSRSTRLSIGRYGTRYTLPEQGRKGCQRRIGLQTRSIWWTMEVREPIFIASFPEKVDTFSIAITRWKPVVVIPQGPWGTIKFGDVMIATFLLLTEPIKRDEWATFGDDFRKMITDSFEMRRAYGRTQTAVVGQAENNARRRDTLLCPSDGMEFFWQKTLPNRRWTISAF